MTRKKGIWVITGTYTSQRLAVALLLERDSSLKFTVDLQLNATRRIAPKASWWDSTKESVWKVASSTQQGIPPFMTGWPVRLGRQKSKRGFLGSSDDDMKFIAPVNEDLEEIVKL